MKKKSTILTYSLLGVTLTEGFTFSDSHLLEKTDPPITQDGYHEDPIPSKPGPSDYKI